MTTDVTNELVYSDDVTDMTALISNYAYRSTCTSENRRTALEATYFDHRRRSYTCAVERSKTYKPSDVHIRSSAFHNHKRFTTHTNIYKRPNILEQTAKFRANSSAMTTVTSHSNKVRVVSLNFRLTSGCHPVLLSQFIMEFQDSVWSKSHGTQHSTVGSNQGLVEIVNRGQNREPRANP